MGSYPGANNFFFIEEFFYGNLVLEVVIIWAAKAICCRLANLLRMAKGGASTNVGLVSFNDLISFFAAF